MWGGKKKKREKKNADGHADGGADRPLLKVMTSRRQVTDIWVFVAAAAAAERALSSHSGSPGVDAASSPPPFAPHLPHSRRGCVHTGLAGGGREKRELCARNESAFVFL